MTSKIYRSSEFFRALPARLRPQLPKELQRFEMRTRNWMLQVYYSDPNVHYEASALPRLKVFEVALHFERRGRTLNDALMSHFMPYAFEIKDALGPQVQFERWDKGWSKIYEALLLAPYDEAYLEHVAERLAAIIACLQPILAEES
jgi:hypothetical protein